MDATRCVSAQRNLPGRDAIRRSQFQGGDNIRDTLDTCLTSAIRQLTDDLMNVL